MGIIMICIKMENFMYIRKKHLKKSNTYTKVKVSIETWFFLLQNAINTFSKFYYDYLNQMTKFCPGILPFNSKYNAFKSICCCERKASALTKLSKIRDIDIKANMLKNKWRVWSSTKSKAGNVTVPGVWKTGMYLIYNYTEESFV